MWNKNESIIAAILIAILISVISGIISGIGTAYIQKEWFDNDK